MAQLDRGDIYKIFFGELSKKPYKITAWFSGSFYEGRFDIFFLSNDLIFIKVLN